MTTGRPVEARSARRVEEVAERQVQPRLAGEADKIAIAPFANEIGRVGKVIMHRLQHIVRVAHQDRVFQVRAPRHDPGEIG
jgi:hypothetical protein